MGLNATDKCLAFVQYRVVEGLALPNCSHCPSDDIYIICLGKWERQVGHIHRLRTNPEWMNSREEDGERERKSGEVRS